VAEASIAIAVAERAYPGETVSGDAWQVDEHNGVYRIAVIDGLGHGDAAAKAAMTAREVLAHHPELAAPDALQACHRALIPTRGAAMWVGQIDIEAGTLTYAGVGNVEARLWQDGRQHRLPPQRGIVGATMPNLRRFDWPLAPGWLLLVHTDGVREHFDADVLPEPMMGDPQGLANGILQAWGRQTDDALVLVAQVYPASMAAALG